MYTELNLSLTARESGLVKASLLNTRNAMEQYLLIRGSKRHNAECADIEKNIKEIKEIIRKIDGMGNESISRNYHATTSL